MKNVLITGANKSIGFETARQMAQLGYYVYLGSRDKERGTAAMNRLKDEGLANVEAIAIDVADINSIKQARTALEAKTGALDILINNAGISGEQPQNFSTCDIEIVRRIFETNFFGAIQTTQQFIPLLKKSAAPVIVNVSSEVGSLTMQSSPSRSANWGFYNAYGSSKTALNAFTVMLANELTNNHFIINSVTPGYTATDLNEHKGTNMPAEAAKPIVKAATLSDAGTTGKFFKAAGETAW